MKALTRSEAARVAACVAVFLAVSASVWAQAQVADMSRYRIKEQRPRIWLTPGLLGRLKEKARKGDKDWQAIQAAADRSVSKPGRDVLSTALVYQVSGDRKYAAATIAGLKDLCQEMQTTFAGRSYDRKWNTGKWIGNRFAVAYDWVRDAMTADDVKTLVESEGLATAGEWLTREYARMKPYDGVSRPHVGTNTWIHWAENMGMVWLSLHGDTPKADEWGRRAMLAASVWTAYHRKVLKGGVSYAAIAYGTSVNTNMFKFCEAVKTATGVDLWQELGDWPEEVVYRWLYWTGPDWKTISHYGHHKRSFNYNVLNDNQEMMMFCPAYHFRGTRTGRLAQGWLKKCSPFPRANGATFERLLLYDPGAPTAEPTDLPLCYLSEYRGEVVARSDWTTDATWVSFRCGKTHTGEFFRPDCGHFNISKGGDRFTADAGSDDYSWGAHTSGFRSTIVIGGKTQLPFGTWRKETGYGKMWQKTPEVLAKKAQIVRDYEETFGKILALEDKGSYVYAAGDLTGAYNVPGKLEVAKGCTRQMVYLRPDTIVFFDRVETSEAGVIEWRCHVPTLEQGRPWGRARHRHELKTGEREFTVSGRKHDLFCCTLLPARAKLSMTPTNVLYRNRGFQGWQMIQVATQAPVKEASFVHVMRIVPKGTPPEGDFSGIGEAGKLILKFAFNGKPCQILLNETGNCGGSIRIGSAAEVPFAEKIVPGRILINRPRGAPDQ